MYDTYARYIYEWLTSTFYNNWNSNSENILNRLDSILLKIDNILTVLQYGLYLGVFAFLFWIAFCLVRPHFFKI